MLEHNQSSQNSKNINHKTTKLYKHNTSQTEGIINSVRSNDKYIHKDAEKFRQITDLTSKLAAIR